MSSIWVVLPRRSMSGAASAHALAKATEAGVGSSTNWPVFTARAVDGPGECQGQAATA